MTRRKKHKSASRDASPKRVKKRQLCRCPDNPRRPSFGLPGTRRPLCCVRCKTEDMVDVIGPKCRCQPPQKPKKPTYGDPIDSRAVCCKTCAEPHMVDVVHSRCQCKPPNVPRRPCFGVASDGIAVCCKICIQPGMVDVVSVMCRCQPPSKPKHPVFGHPEDGKVVCCKLCAESGMVDLCNPKCECKPPKIPKQPSFGYPLTKELKCCSDCREPVMVDLRSRRCRCKPIPKNPSFGYPADGIRLCCADCKEDDMDCLVMQLLCAKCFEKHAVKDGYCTVCHPNYVQTGRGTSKPSCAWIDQLELELGLPIRHSHYADGTLTRNEFRAACLPRRPVDGHVGPHLVFEFLGDIWHGHPALWSAERNFVGNAYQELFRKTEEKFQVLSANGYKIFYIWESEWRLHLKKTPNEPILPKCHVFDGALKC